MNMEKNLLTPNEITFMLIAIMIDVSASSLPNKVAEIAKQDGWISVMIGAIYPLYVAFIAIYISGKTPNKNILILSKKYLGTIIGNLLNLIFLIGFFSYIPPLISMIAIIIRTDAVFSLTNLQIYFILMLMGAYAANKGIKVLGRMCSIVFFMILLIIAPSIMVLRYGSILNVSPVFGAGILNILKSSERSIYDYSCIEFIFLIYPFINDSKKIKSSILKAVGITCLIYTWITFITIYYLGTTVISKTLWSFFSVTEAIKIEIINNFRYIFIFFWIIIALKSTAIFYYTSTYILDSIKKIKNRQIVYLIMSIIIILLARIYCGDFLSRAEMIKETSKISTMYNLMYITLIAVLVWIKEGGKNEKKYK